MRATKKRIMYKKRKGGRRRFTRKMRGGLNPYENPYEKTHYKKYFEDSFNSWKNQREKKSLSQRFRGMFTTTPKKTEEELELVDKFLDSPAGKETIAEINNLEEESAGDNKIKEIKETEEQIRKQIEEQEQIRKQIEEQEQMRKQIEEQEIQKEIKEKEEKRKKFKNELSILERLGLKNKKNLTIRENIKSLNHNISELERDIKLLLEKYSKINSIEFTPKYYDDDDDDDEFQGGKKKRRRTKRRKH